MSYPIVSLDNVSFSFYKGLKLLNNVSFSINAGELCYLTGKSGSGKSTIINLISGIETPQSGLVEVFGRAFGHLSENEISIIRQKMGIIFQDFRLFPHLSVIENVAISLKIRGFSWDKSLIRAIDSLKSLGLAHAAKMHPAELSGGEQQRVVIARAIVSEPRFILADEPTGNLDDENARILMNIIVSLSKAGTAILFATHNRNLISEFPAKELFLENGQIHPVNNVYKFINQKVGHGSSL
jgi:cell division transport system ATP-binding protein